MAVDFDADFVVVADQFDGVPLAVRFFDFMRAAETFFVAPGVAAGTVEAGDVWAFADSVHGEVSAVDDKDVAGAALNHLALDGFGPDAVLADEVDEDAAVAGFIGTVAPGFFTPFEFGEEFVVGKIGLFGRGVSVVLAADVQLAVLPGEDVVGIVVDCAAFEEGVEIIGLEEVDDFGFVGGLGGATREQGEGGESDEKRFHNG